MLSTKVLTESASLEALDAEWRDLVMASPTASPFQTPEWVGAWSETLLGSKKLHMIALYDGDLLVGLMPMVKSRFPWRSLRAMGAGVSDYLHPLAREGYEVAVAEALWEHFQEASGFDLVDLQQIRETSPVATGPAHKIIRDEDCFVLDLPPTWEEYLGGLSKSLRYEAKRLDKPPYSTGEATLKTAQTPEEASKGLDAFFELHARRWRKRGLPGVFALRKTREFHYRFAEKAVACGLLRLTLLESKGKVVGAIYAMCVNQTVFFYQSGFDPEAKALSPGSVLVAHTIREAITGGATHFDFLRGPELYKLRWKPQHRTTNLRLLLPRTKILGGLGESMTRFRGALEARIREKVASRSQPGV